MINFSKVDVTDEKQVELLFSKIEHIDGIVNCSYPRNKNYGTKFNNKKVRFRLC